MNNKNEYVGAVEYAEIEDGGLVKLPNTMFDNITRNDNDSSYSDEGQLKIETLGNDTYRIKKIHSQQIPTIQINIPESLLHKIQKHINDHQVQRTLTYSSVEDFIYYSIKNNLDADEDMLHMKQNY